jgi:hypothetical protein
LIKRRELMEVDMNTNPTFATGGFPQLTFVLVNERMPRNDALCACCGGTTRAAAALLRKATFVIFGRV